MCCCQTRQEVCVDVLVVRLQDGHSYVHVTSWSYGGTTLQSVTLMTGPCATRFDQAATAGRNLTQALAWNQRTSGGSSSSSPAVALDSGDSTTNGCNVMAADNSTVVSLLRDQGAISSREMLLVLLQANATIGRLSNVPAGRIKLGRPVALAGLWSVMTGIDLEMRVNQLVRFGALGAFGVMEGCIIAAMHS